MAKRSTRFHGIVGRTYAESRPAWPELSRAPAGAPNVIFIVLDDVGYGQIGCYGAEIETPNIDRLARGGIRYADFHTTALCSPTRACLLTGRNHHSNGMGVITEAATGFPGYNGRMPRENGMLSEILRMEGYSTFCVGKWHLAPAEEASMAGPFDRWPLGRGFERYYGFLGGETNQWDPDLAYDNHFIDAPLRPGYHLTEDLTDKAMEFIRDTRAVAPRKPFFLYLAYGACHAPHHVPKEYADRYKGKFDKGWDKVREETLARQKAMGLLPASTELSPRNPLGPDQTEAVKAWDDLSGEEKRLFARMMEIFAGFLTHTDHHIGRLLELLEESGELTNTLVVLVSDNGASAEGGPHGSVNEQRFFNRAPESLADNLRMIEELGGPMTYNHYPNGWTMAGNTPFKMWKRYTFEGGMSDPLIVHWPHGIEAKGEIRHQYHHAVDVTPTVLEALGIEEPDEISGVPQRPMEGTSMFYSWGVPDEPTRKDVQYYEMLGTRAIWYRGWKAVTRHEPGAGTGEFDKDVWELYHVDEDRSECHDLAAQHPDRLAQMIERWWIEAGKYNVLPLDDRQQERLAEPKPTVVEDRDHYVYYPGGASIPETVAVNVKNRAHVITADVVIPDGGVEGVLLAHGSRFGGYSFFVKDRRIHYLYNYIGMEDFLISSGEEVRPGPATLRFEFTKTGEHQGRGALYIDDRKVGEGEIPRTVPIAYSLAGEGLCVGRDSGVPVNGQYESPFTFTGTIKRVVVDVSGPPHRDLERETGAALARE